MVYGYQDPDRDEDGPRRCVYRGQVDACFRVQMPCAGDPAGLSPLVPVHRSDIAVSTGWSLRCHSAEWCDHAYRRTGCNAVGYAIGDEALRLEALPVWSRKRFCQVRSVCFRSAVMGRKSASLTADGWRTETVVLIDPVKEAPMQASAVDRQDRQV